MAQIARSLKITATVAGAALAAGCSLFQGPPPTQPSSSSAPPASARTTPAPPPAGTAATAASPSQPASPPPPPPVREHHLSAATQSLVDQTHAQAAQGDLPGASSTLDRALRIEPGNPLLWIERGRLRLAESDAHQAESCGRKALALSSGDRSAQAASARLLADALRAQQRNDEARVVERQLAK